MVSNVPSDDVLENYAASASALISLPIEAGWRPTVLANMKTIATAAALLHGEPIDDIVEAAPVFEP